MRDIDLDGYRLAYGDSGRGPTALFVHGFPLDASMWREQIGLLEEQRRCIAPDLRGFGLSEPSIEPVLGMDAHAEDLVALMDRLEIDRADVVGLSMGGYVALALAEHHPERVRSLALVDTKAEADAPAARGARDAMAERIAAEGREGLATEMAAVLLAPGAPAWLRARVRTMIEGTRAETIVAALEGMRDRPDRRIVLRELTLPVAVIVGEHDTLTPPPAAEAMATRADASFTVVPDAGHLSPLENPTAVAAALGHLFGV
ncbi:MAG: alpha/beta fold hydrolase [Planctomycetota bacterium]